VASALTRGGFFAYFGALMSGSTPSRIACCALRNSLGIAVSDSYLGDERVKAVASAAAKGENKVAAGEQAHAAADSRLVQAKVLGEFGLGVVDFPARLLELCH
jgi:hypothetical protein